MTNTTPGILGKIGNTSGFLSFLGSYNVCHNACMAVIAVLSLVGITFSSLPFLFLQDYAIYFWSIALFALGVSAYMYIRMNHYEARNMMIANAGFVLAGIPFREMENFIFLFQIVGILLITLALASFVKYKISQNNDRKVKTSGR